PKNDGSATRARPPPRAREVPMATRTDLSNGFQGDAPPRPSRGKGLRAGGDSLAPSERGVWGARLQRPPQATGCASGGIHSRRERGGAQGDGAELPPRGDGARRGGE